MSSSRSTAAARGSGTPSGDQRSTASRPISSNKLRSPRAARGTSFSELVTKLSAPCPDEHERSARVLRTRRRTPEHEEDGAGAKQRRTGDHADGCPRRGFARHHAIVLALRLARRRTAVLVGARLLV